MGTRKCRHFAARRPALSCKGHTHPWLGFLFWVALFGMFRWLGLTHAGGWRKQCARWCGRGESNPQGPFSPTDFHTNYGFHRRREAFVVWTIPSPWRIRFRCCPSSLYTFPLPGLARDCHAKGFPEFEQFCTCGFPQSTLGRLKSVASTNSATPAYSSRLIVCGLLVAKKKHD
jgi:hypothetical protein